MYVINKLWFPNVVSGIPLQTKDGTKTGESSVKAAQKGISMVVASRVLMASPGNGLNKTCFSSNFRNNVIKEIQFYEVLWQVGQARGCLLACPCLCLLKPRFRKAVIKASVIFARHDLGPDVRWPTGETRCFGQVPKNQRSNTDPSLRILPHFRHASMLRNIPPGMVIPIYNIFHLEKFWLKGNFYP